MQLDAMADLLEGEGIVVHRTLPMDFNEPVKTPRKSDNIIFLRAHRLFGKNTLP